MSLISQINDLATRIATEFNTVKGLLVPYDDSTPPTTGQTLEFDGTNFVPAAIDLSGKVSSDPTGITGADQITNMVSLTQAEYDAIGTPSATTLYIIT